MDESQCEETLENGKALVNSANSNSIFGSPLNNDSDHMISENNDGFEEKQDVGEDDTVNIIKNWKKYTMNPCV